jgi:hypothetical protein
MFSSGNALLCDENRTADYNPTQQAPVAQLD